MKPQHIVATCLRLLAIAWVLYALNRLHAELSYSAQSHFSISRTYMWGITLLQLFVCAVLWFFPMTIALKLLPLSARGEPVAEPPPQLAEWQTLGIICVGLWGLVLSIPDLMFWVTFVGLGDGEHDYYGGLTADEKARIVATVVKFALSAWLVFGARGFAALLFKIRTGGISKDSGGAS